VPLASKPSLLQFYNYCLEQTLPFAFYRLPEEKTIKVLAQRTRFLYGLSTKNQIEEKGFVFAPFQENENAREIFIKGDVVCDEHTLPLLGFASKTKVIIKKDGEKLNERSKKDFISLIRRIGKEIADDNFDKVVAARLIKKKKPKDFSPLNYFRILCETYPDAFISIAYTKDYGLWIGASPEVLLSVRKKEFKTFALAGTIENSNGQDKKWGSKEKQEQKIVSDYILQTFKYFTKEKPLIEGPKTFKAGNLLHLQTTFVYQSIPFKKWKEVANRLHPTPAVAGFPKQKAIDYILHHEKTTRGFYSGYLGPVNLDGEIHLFVNLRCMQVLKNSLIIYAGCGITRESKPLEEWEESKIKADTLLSLL
jgi:isochorismate synthase